MRKKFFYTEDVLKKLSEAGHGTSDGLIHADRPLDGRERGLDGFDDIDEFGDIDDFDEFDDIDDFDDFDGPCEPDRRDDDEDERVDAAIGELLRLIRYGVPDVAFFAQNEARLDAALRAAGDIFDAAREIDADAEMEARPDPVMGTSLDVVIRTYYFTVSGKDGIGKFSEALNASDAFEALALRDGRAELGLTFRGCFRAVWSRYD